MKNSIKPVRIQRSRRKGAKLVSPNGLPVVCVTRPGRWGNPFRVGQPGIETPKQAVERFRMVMTSLDMAFIREGLRRELRGKNLACFCPLDQVCHADVLLELANRGEA